MKGVRRVEKYNQPHGKRRKENSGKIVLLYFAHNENKQEHNYNIYGKTSHHIYRHIVFHFSVIKHLCPGFAYRCFHCFLLFFFSQVSLLKGTRRKKNFFIVLLHLHFPFVVSVEINHPFNAIFVSEHTEVRTPWAVGNGHFNLSTS